MNKVYKMQKEMENDCMNVILRHIYSHELLINIPQESIEFIIKVLFGVNVNILTRIYEYNKDEQFIKYFLDEVKKQTLYFII